MSPSSAMPAPVAPSPSPASASGLVVAAVQMAPRVGDKPGNVQRSLDAIRAAAANGAHLVVLPELCNSGYVFDSRAEAVALAEAVPDGPTTQAWIAIARELGVHVVAGIAEAAGDVLFNAAVVIGPDGFVGVYRKLHLWNREHVFFAPGDLGLPVFDTALGRIGVIVCYDGWFPEVYRQLALLGADVVCMPTNWVPMPGQHEGGLAMANMLAMAAAHGNGLSVVCADRVGTERGQPFIGRSLIVGADGWALAGPASANGEEILYSRIDPVQARQARHLNDFNHVLADRREDVYGRPSRTSAPTGTASARD